MRYEISETLEISIYADGDLMPFWYQPDYPNGEKFDDYNEAENWAQLAIASMSDDQPYPPNGKGLKGEVKAKIELIPR